MTEISRQLREFWERNPCGKRFIDGKYPSKEFFEQYRAFRYKKEHHLNHLIDWWAAKGKDVLEVGVGIGADGARWAEYANSYTGIDLTNEAVTATRLHFGLMGAQGNILRSDAEALPFVDNKFDIVYSHGVLHHLINVEKGLSEIYRVLKPNGKVILMLYSKDSFNYWLRIQCYFRLRFLFELLKYNAGLKNEEPWRSHLRNKEKTGWSYFSWKSWYHHCTDGPDCNVANIYHRFEIVAILRNKGFTIEKMVKTHFPITGWNFPAFECLLAKYIGFYQFVWAKKI